MNIVTTLRIINIAAGALLQLTRAQAGRRGHNLAQEGEGTDTYRVIRPVQFKAGETFGIDAVDKRQEAEFKIEQPEPEPAPKPAAKKTTAKPAAAKPAIANMARAGM